MDQQEAEQEIKQGFIGRDKTPAARLGAKTSQTTLAVAIMLGIGLLLGSTWASRGQDVFGSPVYLPAGRAIAVILLPFWAYILSKRWVPTQLILVISVIAAIGHAACLVFAGFVNDARSLEALGVLASTISGIFIALMLPLLLSSTMDVSRQHARVSIALGFLIATTWSLIFANIGPTMAICQWIIADIAVLICGYICVRPKFAKTGASDGASGGSGSGSGSGAQRKAMTLPRPWIAAMVLALILMLLYGIVAQTTGYSAAGTTRFGTAGDILLLPIRIIVVLYCILITAGPRPLTSSAVLALAWCVSLAVIALGWTTDAHYFGEILLEAAYNILQTFIFIWAYDVAKTQRRYAGSIFCLASAVMLSNQVTRVAGVLLAQPLSDAAVSSAIVCLTIIAMTGIVMMVVGVNTAHNSVSASNAAASTGTAGTVAVHSAIPAKANPASNSSPAPVDTDTDEFSKRELDFVRRFNLVCDERNLTNREREVLFVALHGYTIDNIAERLSISRETVKSNLARAYARAGVNGKQAFLGLIDETPSQ